MRKCPFCSSGKLRRKTLRETHSYKGQTLAIRQPGEFCSSCGEGILENGDLSDTRKQIHDWQAKIDGFLTTVEVRRIRRKLGLTQQAAALICGGGANAFSRYENGEALQIRATDNLLRLLDRHPELLTELKGSKRGQSAA